MKLKERPKNKKKENLTKYQDDHRRGQMQPNKVKRKAVEGAKCNPAKLKLRPLKGQIATQPS